MIENSLAIGTRLRGAVEYTIVEPLHQGGFGITYRATAQIMVGNIPQTGTFAIKEFFMANICSRGVDGMVEVSSANRQLFRQARQNFMNEAEMLHSLKHEGIVPVNEVFEQNATVYYVMSYLGTMSLYDYVAERGSSLAEDEAKTIMRQLASAVAYLHNRHILHLDIKPGNIMMVRRGNAVAPVLIDFGQAVSFAGDKPKRSKGVGGYSQGYSPLELKQVVTGFVPSIDVYSLAATLLYMLSGADPCDASVQSKHTIYKALPVGVSQAVQDAIIGGLQRDAHVRLKDVSSFLTVLSEGATATSATLQGSTHNPTQAIVAGASSGGFLNRKTISIAVCAVVACGAILLASRHGIQKPATTPSSSSSSLSGNTITIPIRDGVDIEMVRVEAGTFTMGATPEMQDPYTWGKPTHRVTLTNDYYLGKYEVTQAQWQAVMGSNPSRFKGDNLPVEQVSWNDCQEFIRKLNSLTGRRFRLPTEAEWEYAARGGRKSQSCQYSGGNNIGTVAWYIGNSGCQTHPVGMKQANELGIYDMTGNVDEWCQDRWGRYSSSPQTNPTGPLPILGGTYRIYRGGGWSANALYCNSSCRECRDPDIGNYNLGFRLCLSE